MPSGDPGDPSAGRAATALQVLELTERRPATLGGTRLICLDGPAGAGKTSLAAAIADLRRGTTTVHLDDLYEGWGGLASVDRRLDPLLLPLAEGRPGSYRRWDWHGSCWAEEVTVPVPELLVLEGVGSGARRHARLVTTLVWLDAPVDVRRRRGLDRDGDAFAPHWEAWAAAERRHFDSQRTRERADLVLDTSGSASLPRQKQY